MRLLLKIMAIGLVFATAGAAFALTAEEVLKLKEAGVSEETIQKMLELEATKKDSGGPVTETDSEVVYSAGKSDEERQEKKNRERYKEDKALDAAGNVIIDTRQD